MNERIEELYKQSTNQDYLLRDNEEVYMSSKDLEKFAELIVGECMNICNAEKSDYDKHRKNAWDAEEKAIYNEGGAACDTIKHKMKHYFGVEE